MKKETPYFENVNAIANLQMNVDHCQRLIQESLNEWNVICPVPLTLVELKSCLTAEPFRQTVPANVEALLKDKLIENKKVDFDGLQLDKSKLKELIVLPDTSDFLKSLERFSGSIPAKQFVPNADGVMWQYYSLVKGIVILDFEGIEAHKKMFMEFATTTEEINRVKTVMPVCEALNNFIKENPEIVPYELVTRNLIVFDEGKFSPSFVFISSGRT